MKAINTAGVVLLAAFVVAGAQAKAGETKEANKKLSAVQENAKDTAAVNNQMKELSLKEVVVTTQKRNQSSVEVPTAVSAVTGTMLGMLNLNQMDQVGAYIPGIQIQQQSPNNSSYAIRGVTSDEGTATSQPRVSVFLDGVSNFRTQASSVELFDLDRVEVTKGPQGTLFGRGAEIGAIDIIRKKPTNRFGGEFSINYGSFNQMGATGVLNTPIISNKLLNRFAFSFDRHDGYVKNLAGGRLNGKSSLAVRNSTRLFAGDNTRMDLVLDYQYDNYPGTSFKSKFFAPENGYAPTAGTFDPNGDADLDRGKWLGIKRHIGGGMFNISSRLSDAWTFTSITGLRGYHSKENFDADGTRPPLLSSTETASGFQASQELRFNFDNHGPLKGFAGASYFYENVNEGVDIYTNMQYLWPAYVQGQMSGMVNEYLNHDNYQKVVDMVRNYDFSKIPQFGPILNLMKGKIADLIAGKEKDVMNMANNWFSQYKTGDKAEKMPDFYGDIDKQVRGMLSQLGFGQYGLDDILKLAGVTSDSQIGQVIDIVKAKSGATLPTDYSENMKNYAQNHAVDLFADASYTIAKGFTATLGLRGTYEHQRSGYSSSTDVTRNPFYPLYKAFYYFPTAGGKTVWTQKDYFSYVGRFALNYMFKRNNVYVSVSRGRRPGVIEFNNNPDEIVSLKPEIIWNYEAGFKGYVGDNFFYDLCVYYYDWYNFQSRVMENQEGTISKVNKAVDAGRAHSLGFEGTLRYQPCEYASFFATYAYNDAKFNDTDDNGNKQDYAGHRFRLTPKNTLSAGANFTVPVNETSFLYFTPSYTWKSKIYFDDDNDEQLTQKAYGLLNFTLGYHFSPGKVSYDISAYGRNVLNQDYLVDAGNSGRNIGFPTFVGGAPAVFGGILKITF